MPNEGSYEAALRRSNEIQADLPEHPGNYTMLTGDRPTGRLHLGHYFGTIVERVIEKIIIPLLPIYIFGIFLNMTYSGEAYHILLVFAKIIVVIFVLHIVVLLYEFVAAGVFVKQNPFRLLFNMLPAYFTALGTSSSAATIPVTLKQTLKNRVDEGVAGFTIPLCATFTCRAP